MSHLIKIFPADITYEGSDEKSILDAALDAGIHLEHSCKNGSCGICEADLLDGEVVDAQGTVISPGNKVLTCSCKPRGDLSLQATFYPELAGQVKKITPCKVVSATEVSSDVIKLQLRFPPTAHINYLPGQYLNLQYQGVTRSYSIANANEKEGIELHIRNVAGGQMSQLIFNGLAENTLMRIEAPCGTFFIRQNQRPVIFIAGGTGYAPVQAMVESLIAEDAKREIYIYWGMAKSQDFYSSRPQEWADQHANIHYVPVVSADDEGWQGRKGYVHQAVMDDFTSLADFDVYACGSPVMIDVAKKDLMTLGLPVSHFYSDAFTVSK